MKKLKTNLKLVLALGIVIIAMCLFNANTVNAVVITEEVKEKIYNLIPNTITLDIPETECDKASELLEDKIIKILKDKGVKYSSDNSTIIVDNIEYNFPIMISCGLYNERIDKAYMNARINANGEKEVGKEISVRYSNSSMHNNDDEKYIKSLNIKAINNYIEIPLSKSNNWDSMFNCVENYYTNLINDSSITVKFFCSYGGSYDGALVTSAKGYIGIFKNGILYKIITLGEFEYIPYLEVPNSIKDNELTEYVITSIKQHNPEYASKITKIQKGAKITSIYGKNYEVSNGYTVHTSTGNDSIIILKRVKNTSEIDKEDTTTNDKNMKLVTNKVTDKTILERVKTALKNISNKYTVYDINLLENNAKVQPNGKVKVSLPIPNDYNKEELVVYRIEENGEKTKYDVTVEGDNATFETDHFSIYVLADVTGTKQGEKDETPKTGTTNNIHFVLPLAVVTTLGLVVYCKKQNK